MMCASVRRIRPGQLFPPQDSHQMFLVQKVLTSQGGLLLRSVARESESPARRQGGLKYLLKLNPDLCAESVFLGVNLVIFPLKKESYPKDL